MTELYLEQAQDYLKLEFNLKKERRPAYSLRAFARDLQMSSTSLVDVINGKQGLSEDRARQIAKILKWSPERFEHFWTLIQSQFSADEQKKAQALKQVRQKLKELKTHISLDKFKIISDWHHLAILTYLQMRKEGASETELCERLNFDGPVIKNSLARMKRLELVGCKKKVWRALAKSLHGGGAGPSDAVRAYHQQILSQAKEAIEKVDIDKRDNISIVYSIEEKHMAAIHRDIRKAVVGVLNEYSQKSVDDSVQVLTLHMFPVSSEKELSK